MKQEDIKLPSALHGCAMTEIIFTDNGEIWISNREYASQVNYCPITGKKAEIQITIEVLEEENTDNFYKSNEDETTSDYFKEYNEMREQFQKRMKEKGLF